MVRYLKATALILLPGAVPVAAAGYALSWMMEKRKNNNKL